jgi:hypothetical protein
VAQDFIKQGAVSMLDHPLLEAFEGRVIWPGREQRITDEPFDEQMKADLEFQLPQGPAEQRANQEGAHQVGNRMGGPRAGTLGMMEGGTGIFERSEVQRRVELSQEVIVGTFQQFGVNLVTEPVQQRLQVGGD